MRLYVLGHRGRTDLNNCLLLFVYFTGWNGSGTARYGLTDHGQPPLAVVVLGSDWWNCSAEHIPSERDLGAFLASCIAGKCTMYWSGLQRVVHTARLSFFFLQNCVFFCTELCIRTQYVYIKWCPGDEVSVKDSRFGGVCFKIFHIATQRNDLQISDPY